MARKAAFALFPFFLIGAVAMTACIDVTPENDINIIDLSGGPNEHTIRIDVDVSPFDEYGYEYSPTVIGDYEIEIQVLTGPNNALTEEDGTCTDACAGNGFDNGNQTFFWTYPGNAVPGTDTIEVCLFPDFQDDDNLELGFILQILFQELSYQNPGLTEEEFFTEIFCETVTKQWILPSVTPEPSPEATVDAGRPNLAGLAGFLAGLGNDPPTPIASRQAVQGAAGATLAAPRTGDGGLVR